MRTQKKFNLIQNAAGIYPPDGSSLFPTERYDREDTIALEKGLPEPDSIISQKQPVIKEFITQRSAKKEAIAPAAKESLENDWLTGIFLLSVILFVWMMYVRSRRVKQIIAAVFSERSFSQMIREGDIKKERIIVPAFFIYLFSTSQLLFLMMERYGIYERMTGFMTYGYLVAALITGWGLKAFAIYLSASLFRAREVGETYYVYNFVVIMATGILMLPLVILITYSGFMFLTEVVFIIFIIILIFRLLKQAFRISGDRSYSPFHIFIYLCTLEILPFLLLMKMVIILKG